MVLLIDAGKAYSISFLECDIKMYCRSSPRDVQIKAVYLDRLSVI